MYFRLLQSLWQSQETIKTALGVALAVDMVHNMHIVRGLYRERCEEWAAEDWSRTSCAVAATLQHVTRHCHHKDEDLWPQQLTTLLHEQADCLKLAAGVGAAASVTQTALHSSHDSRATGSAGPPIVLPAPATRALLDQGHDQSPCLVGLQDTDDLLTLMGVADSVTSPTSPTTCDQDSQTSAPQAVCSISPATATPRTATKERWRLAAIRDWAAGWKGKSWHWSLTAPPVVPLPPPVQRAPGATLYAAAAARGTAWQRKMHGRIDASLTHCVHSARLWLPLPQVHFQRRSGLRFRCQALGMHWPVHLASPAPVRLERILPEC